MSAGGIELCGSWRGAAARVCVYSLWGRRLGQRGDAEAASSHVTPETQSSKPCFWLQAPNYSLQQLILNFVAKKHRMQSPAVAAVAQSMEAGRGALGGVVPFDDESMSELDR